MNLGSILLAAAVVNAMALSHTLEPRQDLCIPEKIKKLPPGKYWTWTCHAFLCFPVVYLSDGSA